MRGLKAAVSRARMRKQLDSVRIAKPCSASWDKMAGDDRVRFCSQCGLNVYNLSAMDLEEAAELISRTERRPCVRLHRRREGSILTRDCPVGLATWRRKLVAGWSVSVAACAALLGALVGRTPHPQQSPEPQKSAATAAPSNSGHAQVDQTDTEMGVLP